jgi:hypothetical protein
MRQRRKAAAKKSKDQDAFRTASPVQGAADICPSPDASLSQGTKARLALSKLNNGRKREPGQHNVERPFAESSSKDILVQVGAFGVEPPFNDNTGSDDGANDDIESLPASEDVATPDPINSSEHIIEAHVVDDSLADLLEEERGKFEQQARERLLAEIAGQATQAEVVIDEKKKKDGRSFLLPGCFCVMLVLVVAITTKCSSCLEDYINTIKRVGYCRIFVRSTFLDADR